MTIAHVIHDVADALAAEEDQPLLQNIMRGASGLLRP